METKTKISTQDLNLYYGENHALKDVSLDLYENKITAFIGPSGCGKSTYLKTLYRMNDLVPGVKIEGSVRLDDEDIYDPQVDTTLSLKKMQTATENNFSFLQNNFFTCGTTAICGSRCLVYTSRRILPLVRAAFFSGYLLKPHIFSHTVAVQ